MSQSTIQLSKPKSKNNWKLKIKKSWMKIKINYFTQMRAN